MPLSIPTVPPSSKVSVGGVSPKPSEALAAATIKTAQALALGSELGEVKPGYRADLVILEADPYEDIRNTQKIWMVIKDGRVVHRR